LKDADRDQLRDTMLEAAKRGTSILVIEPISLRISPWWSDWTEGFTKAGGRSDEWRIPVDLPPIVKRLARASGLRPEVLTARSLFVGRRLDL
jgi:hypothetical protein